MWEAWAVRWDPELKKAGESKGTRLNPFSELMDRMERSKRA